MKTVGLAKDMADRIFLSERTHCCVRARVFAVFERAGFVMAEPALCYIEAASRGGRARMLP